MRLNNPLYIPRNDLVESALNKATEGNMNEFENLLDIMSKTYSCDLKSYEFQKFQKVLMNLIIPFVELKKLKININKKYFFSILYTKG